MDESSIPIDINIGKLQDWLVSRRHVGKDWQNNILAVREKINNAIQDMPAHDGIAALLSGSHVNYFHCLKIVEILKETEADTKNMFGRYGSQRMKDWLDVIKCYEKDNLYLGEAAQMLVRNIHYEIPSLKKQIAKEEQLQMENEKKIADCQKNEASMRTEFEAACKQLGIAGQDIKSELLALIKDLPDMYQEIAESLPPILPAVSLYSAFCRYMRGGGAEPLPLLRFLAERGDVTVYEWTYGEPPLRVEARRDRHGTETESSNANQIDFGTLDGGDIDFGDSAPGEIDFGDSPPGEIDFGDSPPGEIDFGDDGGEIDWGGDGKGDATEGQQDLASAIAEVSLLDNPSTRALLIEQLVELESFLKMRLYECSTSEGFGLSLSADLPSESAAALGAMLDNVQLALERSTHLRLTHVHNIKHSTRYVDVLTASLQQKLTLCDKLGALREGARARAAAAAERRAALAPLLAANVERCKLLQAQIESDISKKYKGRPVNIIGGVKFL